MTWKGGRNERRKIKTIRGEGRGGGERKGGGIGGDEKEEQEEEDE